MLHGKTLHLEAGAPDDKVVTALKALASLPRLRIMQYLSEGERSVNEVAHALNMAPSTAAAQIKLLEDANFLHTDLQPASHGLQKVCTRSYDSLVIELPCFPSVVDSSVEVAMPIGAYTGFDVTPTCGIACETSVIGYFDDPLSFYEPERVHAGLIWFHSGYVEYSFPNRLPPSARLTGLVVSMEICSEAPLHNNDWPSDITLWINGQEVGTWTSPADFGRQRGQLTPPWWDSSDSQYGLLKRWMVKSEGSFIDGHRLSQIVIRDLAIEEQRVIIVRLGVKADALHVGGMNLFGKSFGNYPQDLVLRLEYTPGLRPEKRT
ncbi:MAG: ArsR family transcriptional regulator [Chloroflexi bacterium]|nr:ArsR family transcriptional regulator [Chloroflexota bacterium]